MLRSNECTLYALTKLPEAHDQYPKKFNVIEFLNKYIERLKEKKSLDIVWISDDKYCGFQVLIRDILESDMFGKIVNLCPPPENDAHIKEKNIKSIANFLSFMERCNLLMVFLRIKCRMFLHEDGIDYFFNKSRYCVEYDIDKTSRALACEEVYCKNLLNNLTIAREIINMTLLSEDPIFSDPRYKLVQEIFSNFEKYYSKFHDTFVNYDKVFREANKVFLSQRCRY